MTPWFKRFFLAAGITMSAASAFAKPNYVLLSFQDLADWAEDDHDSALEVFKETCSDLDEPEWSALCAVASQATSGRAFFEMFFRPVMIDDGGEPLFTGYFEPELRGSLVPTAKYRYPIYRMPDEARNARPWLSRRNIEETGVLKNRGLEIAWIDDPVEVFFLQIQGSGRVRLTDGSVIRVGYGGANGHPYRSIGQELVRRGTYQPHQVSAKVIANWVRRNPIEGAELLRHNPSFVFFREVNQVAPEKGPLGAMNRSITELRSIAVDPRYIPLGAPVWIEKQGETPMTRLMIAQDTGSAIKGAQRADIFFGTGDAAGQEAGRIRDGGRLVTLLPIQQAYRLAPDAFE